MTKNNGIITIHDASDIKDKIRWLINFNHPDNRYYQSTESKVAKLVLNQNNSISKIFKEIKQLEN